MCSPSQGFYSSPTDPPDRSDAADAARFRWLIQGDTPEVDAVRRAIDRRMSQEEFDALTGPTTPSL